MYQRLRHGFLSYPDGRVIDVDRLAELAGMRWWALSAAELLAVLDETRVAANRWQAMHLRAVREVDSRGPAAVHSATSTGALVRTETRISGRTARRLVKLAAAVDAAPAGPG